MPTSPPLPLAAGQTSESYNGSNTGGGPGKTGQPLPAGQPADDSGDHDGDGGDDVGGECLLLTLPDSMLMVMSVRRQSPPHLTSTSQASMLSLPKTRGGPHLARISRPVLR